LKASMAFVFLQIQLPQNFSPRAAGHLRQGRRLHFGHVEPGRTPRVESAGGKIILVPFVPGKSTTSLLEKISWL